MRARRERRYWRLSLLSLPFLLVAAFGANAWRNIADYVQGTEMKVHPTDGGKLYAGAIWRLQQARLIGDGRDLNVAFNDNRRLIIIRLAADVKEQIGDRWTQCRLTLVDDKGHRWLPLDFIRSGDISRELDPKATPVDGCDAVSRHPPAPGADALIEEKFVVPADATSSISVRLSFASVRPETLFFPFQLR